jgi:hypothetical protein
MILAKGLGAGLFVDTSAGVVVLLYLRPGKDRIFEVLPLDLLLEQHNRTGVLVAMMTGVISK